MKNIDVVVKGPLNSLQKKELDYKLEKYLKDFSPEIIIYNENDNEKHIEFDLKGDFDVVKKSNEGKRIIAGYASVAVVDDDNQFIPPNVLEEGLKSLLDDESYANVMVVHKNIQIGKILQEYNDLRTRVDDKGLYIVAEIRNDLESAQGIWRKIVSGVMKGFSIGGEIIEKHNHCDEDKCYEIIDKINLFEVSVCSNPINKSSGFEIIAKSDVCKEFDNKDDKMTKKEEQDDEICEDCKDEKVEKAEDQKEETVEEQADDNVEETTKTTEKTEESDAESTEVTDEDEAIQGLDKIIDRMNEMFATMEKSIVENVQETMKSMIEENPVEEQVEEKSDKVEETEKSDDDNKDDGKEIQYALKARDDAIKGYEEKVKELEARIKELEKIEEEPQTTSEAEEEHLEKDTGIIIKHGRIYRK